MYRVSAGKGNGAVMRPPSQGERQDERYNFFMSGDGGSFASRMYRELRVHTMSAIHFFHVTEPPVPFDRLDAILDPLLERLYEAKKLAGLGETGPDIVRYYALENRQYVMEVGIPVKPETCAAGSAQIKALPAFYCAGVLLWGSLAHIRDAYAALEQGIAALGLTPTLENREWVYYFESPASEQNLMGIYRGLVDAGR